MTETDTPTGPPLLDPRQARALSNALRAFPFSGAVKMIPRDTAVSVADVVEVIEGLAAQVRDHVERTATRERVDAQLHLDVAAMRRVLGTT